MNVVQVGIDMSTNAGSGRRSWGFAATVAALSIVAGANVEARASVVVQELQPTITMTSESTVGATVKKAAPRTSSPRGSSAVAAPAPSNNAAAAALTGGTHRSQRAVKVLPGMKYGGHAKDMAEFQGFGVTRKTGSRYALHFPGESKLNGPLMGVFKDSEERFNACYFGAVDGGVAADAVTAANFRFTISSGTMRVAKLELAPGSKVGKPLAACLGRAMRKLVLPVSKDVAGTFRIEFAHSYEQRQVASVR